MCVSTAHTVSVTISRFDPVLSRQRVRGWFGRVGERRGARSSRIDIVIVIVIDIVIDRLVIVRVPGQDRGSDEVLRLDITESDG